MPGFIVHQGATIQCSHGAVAMPTGVNPRVKVMGQISVMAPSPYTVAGCPFTTGSNPYPCITGQWITFSIRVKSNGLPFVLNDSSSVCTPTGTPLTIAVTQVRVKAS